MKHSRTSESVAHSDTSYRRVADTLRDRIVAGMYPQGARLKVQTLTAELNVSSNPIREALQQLQGEGLVVISPNRGATVRTIDRRLIREIYEVNAILDGFFAARAAQVATEEQVMALIDIHRRFEQAARRRDTVASSEINHEFHRYLGEIADNGEALTVRLRHRNLMRAMRLKYGYSDLRNAQLVDEHAKIISAISSRDPARAEMAAKLHSINAGEDVIHQAGIEEDSPGIDNATRIRVLKARSESSPT